MASTLAVRRLATSRSAPRLCAAARQYSTPTQEPDPQLNGYPQLPWTSRQTLPPLGWQDNLYRRNFGDTVRFYRIQNILWLIEVAA